MKRNTKGRSWLSGLPALFVGLGARKNDAFFRHLLSGHAAREIISRLQPAVHFAAQLGKPFSVRGLAREVLRFVWVGLAVVEFLGGFLCGEESGLHRVEFPG